MWFNNKSKNSKKKQLKKLSKAYSRYNKEMDKISEELQEIHRDATLLHSQLEIESLKRNLKE